MEYRASQAFIDILLEHKFIEYTKSRNPDHWVLLNERKKYDPGSIKRAFRFGRLNVIFDYINICISYNSATFTKTAYALTEDEVKSMLLFTKLSPADKSYFITKNVMPFDIARHLNSRLPPSGSRKKLQHIKQLFDKIIITEKI